MKKIYVVGLGIKSIGHLTLEAVEVIRNAKKIVYLPVVAKELQNFLQELGQDNAESLLELYKDGAEDNDNYRNIFKKICKECEKHGEVALLVPGHPRIGVSVVQWLEKLDRTEYELEVLPGISSFDTMMNDMSRDPIEKGSVILDVNRLLLFDYVLEPALDYYLYHICSVGTSRVFVSEPTKQNDLARLQSILLKYFPENHIVHFISSSNFGERPSKVTEVRLSEFCRYGHLIDFSTSLFIPGVRSTKVNKDYLRQILQTRKVQNELNS